MNLRFLRWRHERRELLMALPPELLDECRGDLAMACARLRTSRNDLEHQLRRARAQAQIVNHGYDRLLGENANLTAQLSSCNHSINFLIAQRTALKKQLDAGTRQ